jgi:hypothetical protein
LVGVFADQCRNQLPDYSITRLPNLEECHVHHRAFVDGIAIRGDFYIRKDFDPKVGLTVVIVGGLISAGFYWFGEDLIAYGILAAAALIDLVVYGRLKDVTVCYRCHSEFRGAYRRTAPAFDLHTADVLEQEYERKIGRR